MAVWSEIKANEAFATLDFAAEHYHPKKIEYLKLLNSFEGLRIGELFSSVNDIFDPAKHILSKPARVYDLTDALGNFLGEGKVANDESFKSAKKIAETNDIIVSRLRSYLKEIAVVPSLNEKVLVSTEYFVLRSLNETEVEENKFILPFLLTEPVQFILNWSQDGNEHPRFAESVLLNLKVPKTVIANKLLLQSLIEESQCKIELSKTLYAKAEALLLHELGLENLNLSDEITYERNFDEVAKAGRLDAQYFQPKYYEIIEAIRKCKKVSSLIGLIKPIKNGFDFRDYQEEGTPYIRVANVRDGKIYTDESAKINITSDEIKKDLGLKIGDVLFTRKGSFGNAAVVRPNQTNCVISSEIMLLRLLDDSECIPDYLSLYLNSLAGFMQIERYVHGVSNFSISQSDLAEVLIALPSIKIQENITALIQESLEVYSQSKQLLEDAKKRVEEMILGGER